MSESSEAAKKIKSFEKSFEIGLTDNETLREIAINNGYDIQLMTLIQNQIVDSIAGNPRNQRVRNQTEEKIKNMNEEDDQ